MTEFCKKHGIRRMRGETLVQVMESAHKDEDSVTIRYQRIKAVGVVELSAGSNCLDSPQVSLIAFKRWRFGEE